MESGDGLIVRVRLRAGSLSIAAAGALARAAARFGNGHIDLTRRPLLQIEGVTPY
jgi:precorrin-3B synthase